MPKKEPTKPAGEADKRTLVDRFFERVKNNRVAAVLIVGAIVIGALASLADSTRKLVDLLPSFGAAHVAGEWKSLPTEFYPVGPEYLRLNLQEAVGGQVLGSVAFSGTDSGYDGGVPREFEILDGKLDGKKLTMYFDNGTPPRKQISGEVAGKELHLVFLRDGHSGVPFTASRVAQAGQLLDARLGITYKGKEFPDHKSACTAMLKDRTEPQVYKLSEVPDEYGNVHCVGTEPDGSPGFDMFQNDVQLSLICPAHSKKTLQRKPQPDPVKGCECDGTMSAVGGQCVAAKEG